MDSKRILITGLSSWWGGRVAQVLERERAVEAVIGVDSHDPRHALERTEFVRIDTEPGVLQRIIAAAAIDTVIDTRLIADPLLSAISTAHAVNTTGTLAVLQACEATRVRKLIFRSSAQYYGSSAEDPAFFSEEMRRQRPPRTAIEADVVRAERQVEDFAVRNPDTAVSVLRFADALVGEPGSSHLALLSLPAIPAILGFDPRLQFVHDDDVIGAFVHLTRNHLSGAFNVAADGVLTLSETASLLGKPLLPVIPPWGFSFAVAQLRRIGLRVPVEMVRQLRYGRGLDNRRLKAAGFQFRYTSRETVLKLRAHQRLRPLLRSGEETYRYDREVEEFLRRSPSVRDLSVGADNAQDGSDEELSEAELIEVISSLDVQALSALRAHERAHRNRATVIAALDQNLARRDASGAGKQDRSSLD
jgi:UDP-glucose 4-epimerase